MDLATVELGKVDQDKLNALSLHGCGGMGSAHLRALAESTVQNLDLTSTLVQVDLSLLKALVERKGRQLVVVTGNAFEDLEVSKNYLRTRESRTVVEVE